MKDFSLSDDAVFVTSERDIILQQIDVLFDTHKNEVFGENSFGSDFEQFLWDLSTSNEDINEYVESLIGSYVNLMGWDLSVETNILAGTQNDIILITIKISKDFDEYEKTYKVD